MAQRRRNHSQYDQPASVDAAKFVRSLRRRMMLTQVEFAELVGCRQLAVWKLENGKHVPHMKFWRRMLELLATVEAKSA